MSFAGFPLSLIWSYFPLAPQCQQMYLSGRNLYNVLEDAFFYLQSVFSFHFHFLVIFMIKTSPWSCFKRCWNGPRMALNKTKSEIFYWGFTTNPIWGVYSALCSGVLRTILHKLWSCWASSKVLQLQIVPIRFKREKYA